MKTKFIHTGWRTLKDLHKRCVEKKYKSPGAFYIFKCRKHNKCENICGWLGYYHICAMWWDKSSTKISCCICWRGPQDYHNRKTRMRKHKGGKRHLNSLPILQLTPSDMTDIPAKAGFILQNQLYIIYSAGTNCGNSWQYIQHMQTQEVSRHQGCPGHADNLTSVSDTNSSTVSKCTAL